MKLKEPLKNKLSKSPLNKCITFRTTEGMLAKWVDECKESSKTLSDTLNEKVRTAFLILFSTAKKEEGKR